MVQVTIHAVQNLNHSVRNFPHSGYLGLTKTLVQGIVRTRVEDDHKLNAASRVTVSIKCYEIRSKFTHSHVNTLVDITQVLWSNPSLTHDSADIGDLDLPFRLVLPADTQGPSTLNFPDYKIFWRLEAAIEHPYQLGLGSRQSRSYDLELTRYDIQNTLTPPIPVSIPLAPHPGYRLPPRCEAFYYRIDPPQSPLGPGDELPVTVSFIFNNNQPPFQLQSLSVALERRINLYEAAGSPTPLDIMSMTSSSSSLGNYQLAAASSSTSLLLSHQNSHLPGSSKKRSDSPPGNIILPSKSFTSPIVNGQSSDFDSSSPAESTCTVNLSLPAKPPPSQWPIGESLKTDLAEIRFELRVKVNAMSPMGPVEVVLEPLEIRLTPISQEQRSIATAKIARKKEKARAKSAPSSRRSSPAAIRRSSPTRSIEALDAYPIVATGRTRSTPGKPRRTSLTLVPPDKFEIDTPSLSGKSGAELDNVSSSGSSRAGPDTPPLKPPPKQSPSHSFVDISYFDSAPNTASTTGSRSLYSSMSASTPALTSPTLPRSEESTRSKPSRSSALKRLPLLSTYSSAARPKITTARTPITPSSTSHPYSPLMSSLDPGQFLGITTPTNLKRMPSNAVRDWEQELDKITNKSKQGSDNMPRFRERTISSASTSKSAHAVKTGRERSVSSASTSEAPQLQTSGSDSSHGGTRTQPRRSTVNALTAFGLRGPPSSFRLFK